MSFTGIMIIASFFLVHLLMNKCDWCDNICTDESDMKYKFDKHTLEYGKELHNGLVHLDEGRSG